MATTTNYSWTTPDDTDLVKDGASAIRTLGSAIDTTVFNNAGAAVSKSLIDAEGDLIVGDAADAVQRLAIGSDGNVLTVDTAVDGKIKWAAPAAGGMTVLASGSLSTGSGSLSLTSISGDYKNLQLVVRDVYPATGNAINLQLNAITDYDVRIDGTDNTNLAGYYLFATTRHRCYYNALATTNNENLLVIDIYDYADTTANKLIVSRFQYNSAAPAGSGSGIVGEFAIVTGFAQSTAAITDVAIQTNSGNFGAAGTYVLYGVK